VADSNPQGDTTVSQLALAWAFVGIPLALDMENGGTFVVDFADGRRDRHNINVRLDAPQSFGVQHRLFSPNDQHQLRGGRDLPPCRRARCDGTARADVPTEEACIAARVRFRGQHDAGNHLNLRCVPENAAVPYDTQRSAVNNEHGDNHRTQ
jgi:hypothetical protein